MGRILDAVHPAVLVVENEEDALDSYAGTPEQYGAELMVACRAAHDRAIRCTDGGLLSGHLVDAVYQHYIDTGQTASATSFADRAFQDFQKRAVATAAGRAAIRSAAARIEEIVQVERSAPVDFVNFHWYVENPAALAEAVGFLREASGLDAVSNEIGQRNDDP